MRARDSANVIDIVKWRVSFRRVRDVFIEDYLRASGSREDGWSFALELSNLFALPRSFDHLVVTSDRHFVVSFFTDFMEGLLFMRKRAVNLAVDVVYDKSYLLPAKNYLFIAIFVIYGV